METDMLERRGRGKVMAFVMAGGEGSRLRPLTTDRCKPAVPFGSRYRIVDFVLTNLVNSDIRSIYLLVQYKPQSLIEHIRKAWTVSALFSDQFVTVVPPQMTKERTLFGGTSDAVYQSLNLMDMHRPDLVAVFGADHIYRMDVRQMVRFHRENDADISVAALPVPLEQASNFGIIETDESRRISGFQEKPRQAKSMPNDPRRAYASMGNYLFNADLLRVALEEAHKQGETDFGHDVIPRLSRSHRVFAYDFSTNIVPGTKPYEEKGYWRDVGTLDTYFEAHRDVLGLEPHFDVFNPQWPIFSSHYDGPTAWVKQGKLDNVVLGAAAIVNNATIRNSILRREVVVEPGAQIEDCIIMDYVRIGRGARLRHVVIDRHNVVPPGAKIGFDHASDRAKYHVTEGGLVVVPLGDVRYYSREEQRLGGGYSE
ncbi:glucose-1-phosphate adenylyltransferase [Nitrosospira sp. Nl5]|uniref:glucose-1-phosphate adenylyltransferase n=1 Tax=Nitrosospira sp. Nl5 TaxID=200120 RepID=UPI00088951E8|nr:glucose-1-phosphate adenylyltransferase [Nitrosospira sp. Nl5]SCY27812.1 glucose-1-phosphate adenylyltransferase [Nitrosospira sp. Nl5]